MRIQMFGSTALACAILVEAIETILGRRARLGQHEINLGQASDCDAKVIEVNGCVNTCGNKVSHEIAATVFVKKATNGKYEGEIVCVCALNLPGRQANTHRFFWSPATDKIEIK